MPRMCSIGVMHPSCEHIGLKTLAASVCDTSVTGLLMQLRLSLTELDRRFAFISEGRTYHGEAINPKGLSLWERMTGFSKVDLQLPSPTCVEPLTSHVIALHGRDQPAVMQSRYPMLSLPCGSCSRKTPFSSPN